MKIKAFLIKFFNLGYYTSKLDEFLADYDKKHSRLSLSQRREADKYDRIHALRDIPSQPEPKKSFWAKF